ncbi:MAG: F0F1 ATP synthase subunit A [Planctomycetota bacterium]
MLQSLLTLAADNPVDHVVNHPWWVVDGWWLWSGNTANLVLSGLILCILGPWVANQIATGDEDEGNERYFVKSRFAQMIEVIAVYLRENTCRPLLHERTDRFMPFLWTLFFFILVNNLLGLIPLLDLNHIIDREALANHEAIIGGTATQNLFVTGALALIAGVIINIAGVRELGAKGFLMHLTGGAPWYLWFLMIPIEILGTFIKPIALAIRLFANMTAGHILMAVLFGFAAKGLATVATGITITPVSMVAAIAIYFLELFVAFLQAFVFMFLTTVFIGQLSHHHDDEHDHAHDEDFTAPGPTDEPVLATAG